MRIKKSETDHMQKLGARWERAVAAATLSVRTDPKLVGLDKIRLPLAIAAALKATGAPGHDGFVIPKEAGPPHAGIQDVVDAAFVAAYEAAERTMRETQNAQA